MTDDNQQNPTEIVLQQMNIRFLEEVDHANLLLEWAVAQGKSIPPGLVKKIRKGQDLLSSSTITSEQKAEFETAHNELTRLIAPVTWTTLTSTSDRHGTLNWLAPLSRVRSQRISAARLWSRKLWIYTSALLVLLLLGENLREYLDVYSPADSESVERGGSIDFTRITFWFSKVLPFLYGALGSCAYLLRSCHKFIHERTFDPRRLPEYTNRILLGFLGGGTILLFVHPESTPEKVSASALAFLAGYSTDFLFTTLERVAGALLPKKTAEEAKAKPPTPPAVPPTE